MHLNLLGKHVVVLNSYEIAKDVLEQSKYSDRPHFTMAGELYVLLCSNCSLQALSERRRQDGLPSVYYSFTIRRALEVHAEADAPGNQQDRSVYVQRLSRSGRTAARQLAARGPISLAKRSAIVSLRLYMIALMGAR